jgi:hypothetical protein
MASYEQLHDISRFDFELSEEDMAELDALDTTEGTDRAVEHNWWAPLCTAAGRAQRLLIHGRTPSVT